MRRSATILDRLRTTYCGSIGIEYMHIPDPEQKQWLQERMEATRMPGSSMNLYAAASSTASSKPKSSNISCKPVLSARSASAWKVGEHHCGSR